MFYSKKNILLTFFLLNSFCFIFVFGDSELKLDLISKGLTIGTPSNLDLGTVSAGSTIESNFLDYFWIEDLRGTNTGHYTTIQCDGLYGPNGATSTVITGIQLSGAVIEKIGGKDNQTLIYSNLNSWTDITTPQLYLYRNDNVANNGAINRYGNKPSIKITVPSGTPAGTYKGKITYTLYDMPFSY